MCRLSAFFGAPICAADLVTRPSRSIITQSFDARERMTGDASTPAYLNGDGFGLGWYSTNLEDPIPCVYRQARPAWNDPNLSAIAEKLYTRLLFAHVRAASAGLDVSESTCHPFRFGRYLFMHNGGLGGFALLRRKLLPTLQPDPFDFAVSYGCSDTALCFAIFLNQLDDHMKLQSSDKLRTCLENTIAIIERAHHDVDVRETSLLNFVVSDGHSLIATRYVVNLDNPRASPASLYYATGNSYELDGSAPGNYVMKHTDRRSTLTIISSEPLTESRADWVSVPRNFCIVVTKSMHVLLSAIRPSPIEMRYDSFSRILATISDGQSFDALSQLSKRNSANITNATTKNSPRLRSVTFPASAMIPSLAVGGGGKQQKMIGPVGAAVRATITVAHCVVLCSTILDELLCSGTNKGDVHVWNMELSANHCVLHTGCNAVQSILGCSLTKTLVVGTSVSTILVYKLRNDGSIQRVLDVCCGGMGNILALAKVGNQIFAGFSDANLRCVIQDISSDLSYVVVDKADEEIANNFKGYHDGEDRSCVSISTTTPMIHVEKTGYQLLMGNQAVVHKGFIFSLASFQDGRFLCSGCGDGILRVWDTKLGECVQMCNDHAGAILTLAVYEVPRGTMLFSGSRDCSVKVWLWDGETSFHCKRTLRKHKDDVVFLAVAGDTLVSGSADGAVFVWNAVTLHLICQYRDHSLKTGAISQEYNNLFTATAEESIQVRDIISVERASATKDHTRLMLSDEETDYNYSVGKSDAENNSRQEPDRQQSENYAYSTTKGNVNGDGDVNGAFSDAQNESNSAIVSEVGYDSDEADCLVPGVEIGQVLAPPMMHTMASMESVTRHGEGDFSEYGYDDDIETDVFNDGKTDTMSKTVKDNSREGREQHINGNGSTSKLIVEETTKLLPHIFERRVIEDALRKFVSIPTVADSSEHRESCWRGARYIGQFLETMGASVKYVNTSRTGDMRGDIPSQLSKSQMRALARESKTNPIVLARFAAADPNAETITIYGHYDVMPAMDLTQWETDPWEMRSVDGYFYGRGTTDNKGPIMAMVFAVKKLIEDSAPGGLGVNIVLVLQGEAEAQNVGFCECVTTYSHWFERTCLILTSNSIWLGEKRPCLTYSFRGVLDLLVSVKGGGHNLHSGVDGGVVFQPMNDLITVLGTLVDEDGVVCIPGFYDDVRPLSTTERAWLDDIDFDIDEYRRATGLSRLTVDSAADVLEYRWRKPSLTIASVETSNVSGFYSVVPQMACAKISIRFVPNQDPKKIEAALRAHLQCEVDKRLSPNKLTVECVNRGDWWWRDPSGEEFQIAAKAVRDVWGVDPEYVCEGGSMPLFSFLADRLNAPLVQVPLGQSSDGAHLPNERIRAVNLFRGKEVLQRILAAYSKRGSRKQANGV